MPVGMFLRILSSMKRLRSCLLRMNLVHRAIDYPRHRKLYRMEVSSHADPVFPRISRLLAAKLLSTFN